MQALKLVKNLSQTPTLADFGTLSAKAGFVTACRNIDNEPVI
jgi:hypothetical protein